MYRNQILFPEFGLMVAFVSGPSHVPFLLSEHASPLHFALLDSTQMNFLVSVYY